MKSSTENKITVAPFDPRFLPGGKVLLEHVPPAARAIIGGHAVALLTERPGSKLGDLWELASRLWERTRALPYSESGATIEDALNLNPSVGMMQGLLEVLRACMAAGDLRSTLLAQRAELDRQIQALDRVAEVRPGR